MAQRLTRLGAEFKASGRSLDSTAALAGALAIYLDQLRAGAPRQESTERQAQLAAAAASAALQAAELEQADG